MLTGLAAAALPVEDAAGLAAAGGDDGPHAVATPTAASAWRNRLRLIFVPASLSIFTPPCGSSARLYLRSDHHHLSSIARSTTAMFCVTDAVVTVEKRT